MVFYHEGFTVSNNVRTAAARSGDADVRIAWIRLLSGSVDRQADIDQGSETRASSKTSLLSLNLVSWSPAKRIFSGSLGALEPILP